MKNIVKGMEKDTAFLLSALTPLCGLEPWLHSL